MQCSTDALQQESRVQSVSKSTGAHRMCQAHTVDYSNALMPSWIRHNIFERIKQATQPGHDQHVNPCFLLHTHSLMAQLPKQKHHQARNMQVEAAPPEMPREQTRTPRGHSETSSRPLNLLKPQHCDTPASDADVYCPHAACILPRLVTLVMCSAYSMSAYHCLAAGACFRQLRSSILS